MHNSISPASTGRLKSVCALLIVTMGLLIAGSASATSVSYTLDAHFIFPSSLDITGQGTVTADDV
ncbi:MAG: hypothetical protein IH973_04320, partial [Myxococcales bacterium]|nr:hypothetical protein [Myxococcales bacterium]